MVAHGFEKICKEHELEVLTDLYNAGYRFAIVTNKGTGKAHYVLRLLAIEHLFDFVIGSDDVKETKPNPEGINEAIRRFNASKEECLYVGDNDIDYETATNAGVDCMICNWGPRKLNVLDKTKYGASGMGGIITKGAMYIGNPR